MSKVADMAKVSAKGSFHLLWGMVVSTIISAVGTIFIGRFLGEELYGLYGIVLTIPVLIGMFRDWGVNSAMVRCVAQYRAEGRETEVKNILVSGLIFEVVVGLILSVICFAISGVLADLYQRPIAALIQIASLSILAAGITNAATAAFTGVERMELNSIMLIIQSVMKTGLVLVLVSPFLGFGTDGAVIGHTIAMLIAGLIGSLLIYKLYRELPKTEGSHKLEISAYIKSMLAYGVPISLAGIIGGFMIQFLTFLLPIYYLDNIQFGNTIIGNYGIANNFVVLIAFFATPITTMLFPAFSKLDAKKDGEALKNVFQFSIKYASLLVVPASVLVMCLAEPAVSALFDSFSSAPLFLALLAITYLYTTVGGLSTGNLINSQGETKYNLKLTIITALIGFPLGAALILTFGVMGLIITTLTAGIPSLVLSILHVKKQYGVTIDWLSSGKILLSAAIAGITTYLFVTIVNFGNWVTLILGAAFFLVTYILVILITRAIKKADIDNLRLMTAGLGPIGRIFNLFLKLLEKIIYALHL